MFCPYCQVMYTLEEPCFCQQAFRETIQVQPSEGSERGLLLAAIFRLKRNLPRPWRKGANHG